MLTLTLDYTRFGFFESETKALGIGRLARRFRRVGAGRRASLRRRHCTPSSLLDFVCSGSCDYLQGAAFAFVMGVDALGAVPPIKESHVEMDAAWAKWPAVRKVFQSLGVSVARFRFLIEGEATVTEKTIP